MAFGVESEVRRRNEDASTENVVDRPFILPMPTVVASRSEQSSDDASFLTDHRSEDEASEGLSVGNTVQVGLDMEHASSDTPSEDGQASTHSEKTEKTLATSTTTNTSSLNLSQAAVEEALENGFIQDGTSFRAKRRQSAHLSEGQTAAAMVAGEFDSVDGAVTEPMLILGVDISHLSPKMQFVVCASGVFGFNLLYGYLQELIAVSICNRQLGLFLATAQFTGYAVFSFLLKTLADRSKQKRQLRLRHSAPSVALSLPTTAVLGVPILMYVGLSLLRAVDLAMTNLAMQYINYPAKTLMKSSRVVFTMIFGVFITRKKYLCIDYVVVLCMVAGLALFMHADATSSAVFQPLGVIMLTISLLCDGAISNLSESIMKNYGVGQDDFIFRMYAIALIAIAVAAAIKGDLQIGIVWMMYPGTYDEVKDGVSAEEASWSVGGKLAVIILFSSMGLCGSSCSAAITKHFGALTMSITSTARKATTLFLSFFLFNNVCTFEHVVGIVIFIAALTTKSLRRRNDGNYVSSTYKPLQQHASPDQGGFADGERRLEPTDMEVMLDPEGDKFNLIERTPLIHATNHAVSSQSVLSLTPGTSSADMKHYGKHK